MEAQILSKEVKDIIRGNLFLQAELCAYHKITVQTINAWLKNDPEAMVSVNTLAILRNHSAIPRDLELTEVLEPITV